MATSSTFGRRLLGAVAAICFSATAFGGASSSWTDGSGVTWEFDYTELDYTAVITSARNIPLTGTIAIPQFVYANEKPFDVVCIDDGAFAWYTGRTGLTLPEGLKYIGERAFASCSDLTGVTFPESLEAIGDGAFSNCTSLASVSFKGPLFCITMNGGSVFGDTPWLTRANANDNWADAITLTGASGYTTGCNICATTEADELAGGGSNSLWWKWTAPVGVAKAAFTTYGSDFRTDLRVYTGSSLNALEQINAISGHVLLSFDVTPGETYYIRVTGDMSYGEEYGNIALAWKTISDGFSFVIMDDGVLMGFLGDCPMTVTIPDGVTAIWESAFDQDCNESAQNIKRLVLPGSVTRIENFAFYRCVNLATVVFREGLEAIGYMAFFSCAALTDVRIPDSATGVALYAFGSCSNLRRVSLPGHFRDNESINVDGIFFDPSPDMTISYREPPYFINFHRYDGTTTSAKYGFEPGVATVLPAFSEFGWARRGYDFKGWATNVADAAAGKVWKTDRAVVSNAAAQGKTLEAYAVWAVKSDCYAIQFVRNDGAGTWRTVGFKHGEKTRLPSVANGLKWARRGYTFKGWALTTADANAGKIWKADWAYVATAAAKGQTISAYAVWELKPGYYQIRFNKNDGSTKWRSLGFAVGTSTKLSTIAALGWTRAGVTFKGWASNKANADAGKVWKADGAFVKNAAAEGKTLSIYAIWE